MTKEQKTKLLKLTGDGHIQKAIDGLLAIERNESLDNEAIAVNAKYSELKKEERLGIVPAAQLEVRKNKIINHLIELINHPDNKSFSKAKSINPPSRYTGWIYITIVMAAIAALVILETSEIIDIIPSNDPLQLTVFVTDTEGNAALEGEGTLNIPLGNRLLHEVIGAKGRTHFPDITANSVGDTIQIGLSAEGWEIVSEKIFVFTGEPITLVVKRDNSLGIVRGTVTGQSGGKFIEDARVVVKDTFVYTNANGFFEIILPEEMRVKKETDRYLLTIIKDGYEPKTQLHYPKSSDAQIRLEKERK